MNIRLRGSSHLIRGRSTIPMSEFNVVAYMNVEAEFQVQAKDEDEAMRIINERIETEGPEMLRESGFIVTTEAGAVDCWEVEE